MIQGTIKHYVISEAPLLFTEINPKKPTIVLMLDIFIVSINECKFLDLRLLKEIQILGW